MKNIKVLLILSSLFLFACNSGSNNLAVTAPKFQLQSDLGANNERTEIKEIVIKQKMRSDWKIARQYVKDGTLVEIIADINYSLPDMANLEKLDKEAYIFLEAFGPNGLLVYKSEEPYKIESSQGNLSINEYIHINSRGAKEFALQISVYWKDMESGQMLRSSEGYFGRYSMAIRY